VDAYCTRLISLRLQGLRKHSWCQLFSKHSSQKTLGYLDSGSVVKASAARSSAVMSLSSRQTDEVKDYKPLALARQPSPHAEECSWPLHVRDTSRLSWHQLETHVHPSLREHWIDMPAYSLYAAHSWDPPSRSTRPGSGVRTRCWCCWLGEFCVWRGPFSEKSFFTAGGSAL
jgi:hypothetical protein